MKFARFLFSASPRFVVLIALVGIVNGLCSAGLIAAINRALNHPSAVPTTLVIGFLGLILGKVSSQAVSQALMVRFAQNTLLTLCERLCRSVAATPFRQLERIGIPRILTALTDDIMTLGSAIQSVPYLVVSGAVLAACGSYLVWLSWTTFLWILGLLLLGTLGYWPIQARAQVEIRHARAGRETLFRQFRALTEGIKELKLHRARREAFFSCNINETLKTLRLHNLAATRWYLQAECWTQAFFYGMLAFLLFALPVFKRLPVESITGYVFGVLYLMSPVWGIIGSLPVLNRGQVALEKIEECELSLAPPASPNGLPAAQEPSPTWAGLEMDGIVFAYDPKERSNGGFVLGPVDFALHPGEVVFLVGGNGSGKSTFVKLLAGLYVPQAGQIRVDGKAISDVNREWYRQHFSVVFSDFYLFDQLLGLSGSSLEARAREYLVQLQLDRKVQVVDGRFSTTALSQGQRKRLALLTAYLEDRPIYVFDEWAADQDPTYKEIFYRHIVPDLRQRGKGVVVITHDDRYFSLGDRVIRLEDGRVPADAVCPGGVESLRLRGWKA